MKQNRSALVVELQTALQNNNKSPGFRSAVLPELSYRFEWAGHALVTTRSYNAYRHAESHFSRLYQYANKFTVGNPFLLTMVSFPWFNGIITDFNGSNEAFYRSVARRVFFQHRNDSAPFAGMDSRFTGSETVFEVSRKIAAIVFLEDRCILGTENSPTQAHAYIYLNPLADHRRQLALFEDYLSDLRGVLRIDDFEHDNY